MARLTLEDFDGVIDAIVFPKVFERRRNFIANDRIVGISGRVSFKDESEAEILVEDIVPIENIASLSRSGRGYERGDYYAGGQSFRREPGPAELAQMDEEPRRPKAAPAPLNDPVKLRVPQEVIDAHGGSRKLLMHITDMISFFPGDRDVLVYLPGQKPVRCSADMRVKFTGVLKGKLVRLLGEENVKG